MDQTLLRAYLSTVYELPYADGILRVSMDGDVVSDPATLPAELRKPFAVVTAYNPRSMLLPRKINDQRNAVMRELLVLGCYRVEPCTGYDHEGEGGWREPSWLVHDMNPDEALAFGRVFRQNAVLVNRSGVPELVITDPTCDDVGTVFRGNWRIWS